MIQRIDHSHQNHKMKSPRLFSNKGSQIKGRRKERERGRVNHDEYIEHLDGLGEDIPLLAPH